MIEAINLSNAHLYGDALFQQFRFRYEQFVMRSAWDVPTFSGMEYDQFDTPASVYLISRNRTGDVQGMIRLLPMSLPFMTKTLWPELYPEQLDQLRTVGWESTRFAVSKQLPKNERTQIIAKLIIAALEFGIERGIKFYLMISPLWIVRKVLEVVGLKPQISHQSNTKDRISSVILSIDPASLELVRNKSGINGPVLRLLS